MTPQPGAGAPRPTILIVDDDPHIREVVRFALEREGFATAEARDGAEALAAFDRVRPALLVLDILMPEMNGTDVCARLRRRPGPDAQVPVIFLSSRDDEVDRIVGLELGGDDYVTKPFSPKELVARVRAVLRRAAPVPAAAPADTGATGATGTPGATGATGAPITTGTPGTPGAPGATSGALPPGAAEPRGRVLRQGRLAVDLDRHRATWDGREVVLTATEFGLLAAMLAFPGKVYSRDELMARGYPDETFVSDRTIDSHVRRLRAKFAAVGAEPVETVHGVGYRVGACE